MEQAMSTRYTNAKRNNTWEPPFTFKNEDGTEGIAVPPHVSLHLQLWTPYPDEEQFSGIEKDEIIPKEWLEKMDEYQHKLTADIQWDTGDFLVIDVSKTLAPYVNCSSRGSYVWLPQNFAAQHARWAWQGERKILASFWDQPGFVGKPMTKV